MSKTVSKVAGFVIGAVLIGIGIATGNPALIVQGAAMIVTQAVVDLTAPKAPARQASEMSIQLGEQPRTAQFGETATAGSLVDGFNYGGKYETDWEVLIIRLADHKCEGMTGFYVNDEYNLYTGDGPVSRYKDKLEIYFRSDATNQTIASVVTDEGPGWTAADVGESGCDVVVAYKADKPDAKHPVWPGGRPRFLFVIKGALCYDPRLDDTVPGGAGDHRYDDPDTWEWSENPAICRYKWVRGIYANDDVSDPGALLVGRGLTAEEAPPENIFAAANLCGEGGLGALLYRQIDTIEPENAAFAISANGNYLIHYAGDFGSYIEIEWWHVPSATKLGSSLTHQDFAMISDNVALADDGTAYFINATDDGFAGFDISLYTIPLLGVGSFTVGDSSSSAVTLNRVLETSVGRKVFTARDVIGYLVDAIKVVTTDCARDFCLDDERHAWMLSQPTGSSAAFTLTDVTGAGGTTTLTGLVTRGAVSAARVCYVSAFDHFVVQSDGKFYIIPKATMTIAASGVAGWGSASMTFNRPSATSFWTGFSQYSLEDGSLLRTVTPSDWVSENTSDANIFAPSNNAFWSRPDLIDHLTIRFLNQDVRYRIAGPVYANQQFLEVEEMFAAATAGNVVTREGSVELEPGQAKSVVATFTDSDLLSGSDVNWNQGFLSDSDAEWVNTVVPRYVEPNQKWNDHAAPVLRDTADIIADGRPREASITLRLVRDQEQALRIGEINRRLGRIWGRASVRLGPRFCELEEGDWIDWQSNRYFGGGTKTFRIEAYSIDVKWQISLTLREIDSSVYEDDGVFDFDESDSTPIFPPPDIGEPDGADWALSGTTLTGANGNSVPALVIDGAVPDDENAEAVIVEYWVNDGVLNPVTDPDSIPWVMKGRYPPTTTHVEITGLTGGATYYIALTYVVSGIAGDRLVLGPQTVADLDVSGQVNSVVGAAVAGFSWKQPVRAATTANGTLASAFENGDTIDGVTLATGDRILLKNQSTGSQNGIYTVNASGAPTRSTDADSAAELVCAAVKVSEGTANADSEWMCTTNAPITVGTTALVWAQQSASDAAYSSSWNGSIVPPSQNAVYDKIETLGGTVGQFLLESRVLAGTSASETFTIPGGYRDVKIVIRARGDAAGVSTVNVQMRLNGDTGNTYDDQRLQGTNVTTSAAANAGATSARIGSATGATAVANEASLNEVTIYEYSGTTFRKVGASRCVVKASDAVAGLFVLELGQWWRSTAAITSATFFPVSGNFIAGTTFTVYGLP